jgi:hypothetical protein
MFDLSLSMPSRVNKRALQDICAHYEAHRIFRDTSEIRQLIHSHLGAGDVLLRRWSLKALGLIGNPQDTHRIVERFRIESDHEAVTWGTAALFKNTRSRSLQEIAKDAGLETDKALVLAARLYADDDWIKQNQVDVTISLNDDPLILKWATFLIGYDKAPATLFDPRYENEVFLGELNQHDVKEVAEYSVWALWERPEYTSKFVRVPLDQIFKQPENVRKWLYRLHAKSHKISGLNEQVLLDLRANDNSPACEGLAQGIVDVNDGEFDNSLTIWYADEPPGTIKDILLKGIIVRASANDYMTEIAEHEFVKATPERRRAILAHASGHKIYNLLRVAEQREIGHRAPTLPMFPIVQIFEASNGGVVNMTNGNSVSIGGNVSAQNVVVGGDMVESAHNAVQSISNIRANDKEVLDAVLGYLRNQDPKVLEVQAAYKALKDTADNPTVENKKGLIASLAGLGQMAAAGGGVAEIIGLVTSWIG